MDEQTDSAKLQKCQQTNSLANWHMDCIVINACHVFVRIIINGELCWLVCILVDMTADNATCTRGRLVVFCLVDSLYKRFVPYNHQYQKHVKGTHSTIVKWAQCKKPIHSKHCVGVNSPPPSSPVAMHWAFSTLAGHLLEYYGNQGLLPRKSDHKALALWQLAGLVVGWWVLDLSSDTE